MQGPISWIRSDGIENYRNQGAIFEWSDDHAYLIIDQVAYGGRTGAVLCYHHPPVHQIGTPGLHAFHDGLDVISRKKNDLAFLLLCSANTAVHSGGDLKESLNRLKKTLEAKNKKQAVGAPAEEIDRLFSWGEDRLEKGVALYRKIRNIARTVRVLGVCGGGLRFGGSAEIPLMADVLIGDSRSGMCFSEALIGIIPGWGGITRVVVKSGTTNAAYMAKTARRVHAPELKAIGIYNRVVEIPFPFPELKKSGDPAMNDGQYQKAFEDHEKRTGALLLPAALDLAICPPDKVPVLNEGERRTLATPAEIAREVSLRAKPGNYSHLWGKPLKAVREEIARLGRPLAPQSVDAIDRLLKAFDATNFDEAEFVDRELLADAALYRDPRFLEGLSGMLEQRVPDFRLLGSS